MCVLIFSYWSKLEEAFQVCHLHFTMYCVLKHAAVSSWSFFHLSRSLIREFLHLSLRTMNCHSTVISKCLYQLYIVLSPSVHIAWFLSYFYHVYFYCQNRCHKIWWFAWVQRMCQVSELTVPMFTAISMCAWQTVLYASTFLGQLANFMHPG